MRKVIGFLFPWRNTFKRLELEKQWWHRLAVVVFFVALVPALVFAWVMADEANGPTNTSDSDISYWTSIGNGQPLLNSGSSQSPVDLSSLGAVPQTPANIPPPPPGYGPASVVTPTTVQKSVRMPNGETATYPGTATDASIEADWKHMDNLAMLKAALYGFGWAVLVTVLFSYLLQAAYRALVYVIYGAKARATPPDSPVAG